MVDEVGAIVGGCVAGGVVLFVILGIIIYHAICKRKHRKRREQSKFRPISPQTSPAHSQPSTLGPDGRLPKVNSTGLWVGAPSMYTGVAPSPAYYYGPGKAPTKQAPIHPGIIQRASSDPRIPNSGLTWSSYKPMYGSHGNLLIMPLVGAQPRIYHSSQPLAPVFEVPPASNGAPGLEIYDVYQFGGGGGNSRSKLIEERHTKQYYEEIAQPNSRLARSQSDVQEKHKKHISRNAGRSRDSASSSSSTPKPKASKSSSGKQVNRSSSSSNPRDDIHRRHAPAPPRPSSSSVVLLHHNNHNNNKAAHSKESSRFSSSAPGYRIGGMKSKSLDALDDNLSRSSFGGGLGGSYYNRAFDPGFGSGDHVSSLSGDIILRPAAPKPSKVASAASSVISSSTPRSDTVLPNGVIAGNVSSKPSSSSSSSKDKTSNDISTTIGLSENEVRVDSSATDSMKLLAKNKTDDQKTTVIAPASTIADKNDVDDVIKDVLDNIIVEDKDISKGHIHYIYQGDIYAVPDKPNNEVNLQRADNNDENPIISRMKNMVVEKTRTNSQKSMSSSREYINKNDEGPRSPTTSTPRSFASDSIVIDTEYQEIGEIVKAMESNKNEEIIGDGNNYRVVVSNAETVQLSNDNFVIRSSRQELNGVHSTSSSSKNRNSTNEENGEVDYDLPDGRTKYGNGSPPTGAMDRNALPLPSSSSSAYDRQHSSSSTKAADTTFEEINNKGKQITDSAFEFLNTYLSDDEGGDGQTSP